MYTPSIRPFWIRARSGRCLLLSHSVRRRKGMGQRALIGRDIPFENQWLKKKEDGHGTRGVEEERKRRHSVMAEEEACLAPYSKTRASMQCVGAGVTSAQTVRWVRPTALPSEWEITFPFCSWVMWVMPIQPRLGGNKRGRGRDKSESGKCRRLLFNAGKEGGRAREIQSFSILVY